MRNFDAGDNINGEGINASFGDGVLKLTASTVGQEAPLKQQIDI
jgi:HSP20 family molecular chaperone IbpA